MITYTDSLEGVTVEHLQRGFFVGWPNPPAPADHYRILTGSSAIGLARLEDGTVVGFITAISDGVSVAYIPHLEILPAYKGQGLGTELVKRMLAKYRDLYGIDLVCDVDVQPFYERLGMKAVVGMVHRNYDRQACTPIESA